MIRLAKAIAAMVHSFAGFRRGLNGGSWAKLLVSDTKGGVTADADAAGGAAAIAAPSGSGSDRFVGGADGASGVGCPACSAVLAGSGGAGS